MTPADLILILIIILGAAGSYLYLNHGRQDKSAYIYYHNTLLGVYPLTGTRTIQINDNCRAEISHSKIRMTQADCPDKRCVRQGWSDVLPIICLPNQIIIEIKSNKNKQQIHILQ